ncbi:DUF2948 family protein [Cochlodiniinecator piscidefendens]|uniref:DUF2948 family protein n=1 Tax=Cochlodiniinecator piscidefendens TaxID=2715756 RepID=UPI00140CA079|nr:DUF2948 family protein [Cochlodiniinecator piscidefendens]
MAQDATFEEGGEQPLRLKANDTDDLAIIASLAQDAVFPASEISFQKSQRRFAILLNRFRWEDKTAAERRGRSYERVQSVLLVEDVLNVKSQGVERGDADTVLSLLSVEFEPGEDGTGRVVLTLAGDGAIALDVEVLDVALKDVTRPYVAPSKQAPKHDD